MHATFRQHRELHLDSTLIKVKPLKVLQKAVSHSDDSASSPARFGRGQNKGVRVAATVQRAASFLHHLERQVPQWRSPKTQQRACAFEDLALDWSKPETALAVAQSTLSLPVPLVGLPFQPTLHSPQTLLEAPSREEHLSAQSKQQDDLGDRSFQ